MSEAPPMEALPYVGRRFDGASPHVESYFVKANDRATRRAVWVRATIFASAHDPRAAIAETWAIAFDPERGHTAVRAQAPYARARFAPDRLDVAVDGVTLTPTHARGAVMSGGRSVLWDLALASTGPALVHFPHARMYEGPLPSSKLVSPLLDARARGEVTVGGETWRVDDWPAMLGHNWGARNAPEYAWGHCNAWDEEEDLVFEGLTARAPVGPLRSPPVTLAHVRHRGVRYDFTSLACVARNRGTILPGLPRAWRFHARSEHARIEGELSAATEDFVGLNYQNPAGPLTYCLNTKIARGWIELALGGRPARTFHTSRAALELGTHRADHGVRMYV